MKDRISILVFCFFVLTSCIERIPPAPPTMTISPDTMVEISVLNYIKYNISVHSNEELVGFKLTSSPGIFHKDTSFAKFSHDLNFSFMLELPYMTAGLPDDSIVTLTMEVSDKYNKTSVTRQMRIIQGYPSYITRNIKLEMPPNKLFYSFTEDSLFYINDDSNDFTEIAFYWDETFNHVLCSPDAKWLDDKLSSSYPYDNTIMKHTKMQKLFSDWDDIDAKYLYELIVTDNFINGSPSLGVGVNNLQYHDVVGFELEDGRKGVIQIYQILKASNSISFNIKIQEHAL